MATIGFTNKPAPNVAKAKPVKKEVKEEVKIIPVDKSWCRPYCVKCPYFANDEPAEMIHCVRPTGENCLADNILVAGYIMQQAQAERIREMATAEATRTKQRKSIPHKNIKRRIRWKA